MSLETSSLPDELISEILEYTDCKTLLSCRTSSTLQYIIELFGTGMCDGKSSGVGSAERLDRLRRSQMSWKSPTWHEPADFPYSKMIRSIPAAVSGNLMIFYCVPSGTYLKEGLDLLLLRFPSELRGIPEQQWSLNLDCKYIHDICVDDSQDLLCFISSVSNFGFPSLPAHHAFSLPDVHVRTLSTGGIHPLSNAVGPIYSFAGEVVVPVCLQIYDDLLMLAVNSREDHTLVFNWRTGGHVARIPSFPYTQCAFLDRTNIILSCDIYNDGGRKLHLRAVTLPNAADDASLHSYDFELPTPNDDGSPGGHTLCANTLPSNHSASYVRGLFHVDPRRLLALERETLFQEMCAGVLRPSPIFTYSTFHMTPFYPISKHILLTLRPSWYLANLGSWKHTARQIVQCDGDLPQVQASTHPHGQGDSLRVMDYHPRRVARILATEDMYSPGEVSMREGPESSNTTAKQRSGTYTSWDEGLPYALKEILLPNGRDPDMHYHIGEDVVVLIKVGCIASRRDSASSTPPGSGG
ncbi:hypothetical protein BC826DRAFT_966933 [Russula brevipes]|nr:hypothetical protein BC826DRAFT_966933 [Russula brevipes]